MPNFPCATSELKQPEPKNERKKRMKWKRIKRVKKNEDEEEKEILVADDDSDSDDESVASSDFKTPRERPEQDEIGEEDQWASSGWFLYRIHNTPRTTL